MSDFDCRDCGACCGQPKSMEDPKDIRCIHHPAEIERLPEHARLRVFDSRKRQHPRWGFLVVPIPGGYACEMFEGEVGKPGGCRCTIHEVKPFECANYLPGSTQCLESRQKWGLPPELGPTPLTAEEFLLTNGSVPYQAKRMEQGLAWVGEPHPDLPPPEPVLSEEEAVKKYDLGEFREGATEAPVEESLPTEAPSCSSQ